MPTTSRRMDDYRTILACECCKDKKFEESASQDQDDDSQTTPSIITKEIEDEYLKFTGSKKRVGRMDTLKYMKIRYELKHPERKAFLPQETGKVYAYKQWRDNVWEQYVVRENILYKIGSLENLFEVATEKNALQLIARAHEKLDHGGINLTFAEIANTVHGIPKNDVRWFVSRCSTCLDKQPNKILAPTQPLVSSEPLERIAINLIDLTCDQPQTHSWIFHMKDHYSRFTRLYPLKTNGPEQIVRCLKEFIETYGSPKILQCDDRKEFRDESFLSIINENNIELATGGPTVSINQRSVKKSSDHVKRKIISWRSYSECTDWSEFLANYERGLNRFSCSTNPKGLSSNELFKDFVFRKRHTGECLAFTHAI